MATAPTDTKEKIPDPWRDPTGWHPTALQMSVTPESRGVPWAQPPRVIVGDVSAWVAKVTAEAEARKYKAAR